jgi:hypothetical protein
LEVAGDFLDIPKFTNVLLYWIYVLVALVILVTFGFVLAKFVETFKVNPKRGLVSVGVVLGAIALCALCWFLGSPEKVEILGYEGTDNVGNMARLSDAILYLVELLIPWTILVLVWGVIYTKVKK